MANWLDEWEDDYFANLPEREIYKLISEYMNLRFKNVVYRFDLASDMKLTKGQANRHHKLHPYRGFPDLFIAKKVGEYGGLFLEIKKSGTKVRTKKGEYYAGHIAEQGEFLEKLRDLGYAADFAIGYSESIEKIENYLGGKW